jgi:hypothetical protein
MSVHHDEDGSPVPAMPLVLFPDLAELTDWISGGWKKSGTFDKSLSHLFHVSRVPPKIDPESFNSEALRTRLSRSTDGLSRFASVRMMRHNIGSNRGLMKVIKEIIEVMEGAPDKYMVLSVDLNIYDRLIKVTEFASLSYETEQTG